MKHEKTLGKDKTFSIFHNNVRSLSRNLENLETHLLDELDFHFDLIGVTETKITNSNELMFNPNIAGYTFEYVPTPLASGGVGLFINEALNYEILEKTSNEAFQALWIEISFTQKKNIICGIIYRQHNSPEQFQQYFENTIEKLTLSGKQLFLMGDINIDLLKSETCRFSHDFLLALQSCYLIPTIDKPTRVYNDSATLIDNIFVNIPDQVFMSGNVVSDISDHFSQFCILQTIKDKHVIKKSKIRDFSNFSAKLFNDELSKTDWKISFQNNANDIDKIFSCFYKKFIGIANKHAPLKTISARKAKRLTKPWITEGIRSAIKKKNQLFASGDFIKYKFYRNQISKLTRISKMNYYNEFFDVNMKNIKKTWIGINNLLTNNRKTTAKPIHSLKDPKKGNKITTDPSHIPNILNDHFATVGNKLANKQPVANQHFSEFLNKTKSPESSFLCQPVSAAEIEFEILSIPNNKSHGLYSCPTKLLKYASSSIKDILAEMFNLSVQIGSYPTKLKTSKITPIHKSDDESDPNNYIPISLLSNFNRIFEKK